MWVRLVTDGCCAEGVADAGCAEADGWLGRKRLAVQVRLLPLGCCVDVGIAEVGLVDVIVVALVFAADRSAERILAIYPGNLPINSFPITSLFRFLSPLSLPHHYLLATCGI